VFVFCFLVEYATSREAMHKHCANAVVLYNLKKRRTNIIQTQQYYTISGNDAQTLYKRSSIIQSRETMHVFRYSMIL
jgi:hypothetical protein